MTYIENILVVGKGVREHAVGDKLAKDNPGTNLFFAPGNGGTSDIGTNLDIGVDDFDSITDFARDNDAFTVVGPDQPIVDGLGDALREAHVPVFAPTAAAARLEGSKVFAAEFNERHGIQQPRFFVARSLSQAIQYVQSHDASSYVIKADGLALGKGVHLPSSTVEATNSVYEMMHKNDRTAHKPLLFQERLTGREVSMFAFTDGTHIVPLLPSQDHKRAFDHDIGPNTGGMGAYAPAPFMSAEDIDTFTSTILQKTVDGMREDGTPYKGGLYVGGMMTDQGPQVLEYNARFGDPEAQPLLTLMSSELAPVMLACMCNGLRRQQVRFRNGAAACVVLASEGYPDTPETGQVIYGLDQVEDPNITVFHAGTSKVDGDYVVSGGRVLGINAYGRTVKEAIHRAYAAIGPRGIHFDGMFYRTDIGHQVVR